MPGHEQMLGSGSTLLSGFLTVALWSLVIFAGFVFLWLLGSLPPNGAEEDPPGASADQEAEQALAQRYVWGRIDDQEYQRQLGTLRDSAKYPDIGPR